MVDLNYKGANVSSIQHDDDSGTIRAIVSVTGIEDNVKDIIVPGAYEKSLKTRIPKGVWQHQWTESIAKTTAIKELMPGDADLPKTLANGQPWPANAGGLLVDMEFNLKTQRGRESYEDVKFFGDQQEWSIGYSVPPGGATKDSKGIRTIHTLDLYEYSPVLFGAMSNARTTSVKDAQNALIEMKSIFGDDTDRVLELAKGILEEKSDTESSKVDDEDDLEDIEDFDNDDTDEKEEKGEHGMAMVGVSRELIQNAIDALQAMVAGTSEGVQEEKSLYDLMEDAGIEGKILDEADEFDEAVDSSDVELAEKSALSILDVVEAMVSMDGIDEKTAEDYRSFATYIGENISAIEGKADDTGEYDDEEDVDSLDDGEDAEAEEKSFQKVNTSNRFVSVESKSAIESPAVDLFGGEDDEETTF